MKDCNCNKNNCCGGECHPARYGCDFDIYPDPYNDSKVDIVVNGTVKRTSIPVKETDTKLSTDTVANTLNYSAERHSDILTGKQVGGIIELGDLSDVRVDESLTGSCYELVFHKYGNCGEGCISPLDAWSNFNINSEGAKKDWINYVRGANAYGCPEYLDEPTNPDQYWFAGWRQDGEHKEFGYYQADYGTLPKDALGNYIVMSQDPTTKKPIYGTLPLDCILRNLVGNLGIDVFGTWSVITATPAFSSTFNAITGDWSITWNDWDLSETTHYGSGRITGKLDWTAQFNTQNGHMDYHITAIHYYVASYVHDVFYPGPTYPSLTLWGIDDASGTEVKLIDAYSFTTNDDWTININETLSWDKTISVAPNQTVGPFNYAHLFVDWIGDDNGYTQVNFRNKLAGWQNC